MQMLFYPRPPRPRVRMKRSSEENTLIMRTYYYITNFETDLTVYKKKYMNSSYLNILK